MRERTGMSELKAALSEYLRRVKSGDEIIVTDRGQAVAKIVPFEVSESVPSDLRDLEKEGLISVGKEKLPKKFWDLPRPEDSRGLVLKALIEERERGR